MLLTRINLILILDSSYMILLHFDVGLLKVTILGDLHSQRSIDYIFLLEAKFECFCVIYMFEILLPPGE